MNTPKLEDIYDRVVFLVENSYEPNVFLFGEGLPVYERGTLLAEMLYVYYDTVGSTTGTYNCVKPYSRYSSIHEMKECAGKVYSERYLQALYESAFDGISEDLGGERDEIFSTYTEDENWLYEITSFTALVKGQRIYDYATMQIVGKPSQKYVQVLMDSYKIGDEEHVLPVKLTLVNQSGQWYLDSPTY